MVEQIFLSPQVKRNAVINSKLVHTSSLKSCQTVPEKQHVRRWGSLSAHTRTKTEVQLFL